MDGNKDNLSNEEAERIWERYQAQRGSRADADWEKLRYDADNQRYAAVLRQKIHLKANGVEMDFGTARAGLLLLRELQVNAPDQFAELVRSVRPSGAVCLPELSLQMAIARIRLKEGKFMNPDGRVCSAYAELLDAAYTETTEGVVLRDPVVPPNSEFVKELIAAEREVDQQLIVSNRRRLAEEHRKPPSRDDGMTR